MSKGKLDKHDHESYEELEDDYFDDAFDLAFDEAFRRAASTPPTPSKEQTKNMQESWLNVQTEINKIGKRRRRKQTFWLSGVVAASVALGALLFSVPAGTQAVSPFMQTIKDWGNGMKSIVIKDGTEQIVGKDPSTARTPPPPEPGIEDAPTISIIEGDDLPVEYDRTFGPVEVTEEQARSGFLGDFLLSNAIPERFTHVKFELLLEDREEDSEQSNSSDDRDYESDHMRVRYSTWVNDNEEEVIQFDYMWIRPGQVDTAPVLRETDMVRLDDGSEALIAIGPPYNTFQWMMGSTNVSMFGTINKAEMLAIANDLQKQRFPSTNR
ncbi:hypothetical protein [Paenibacillus xylanexedens]|uniref:hypothetical protein n=1 Tax=Paenibacillus xylanexedens TaxID=528191 RepID=UPI001642DDD2|nr:hypothetical protein [Paenibacillus xylanexedens]